MDKGIKFAETKGYGDFRMSGHNFCVFNDFTFHI